MYNSVKAHLADLIVLDIIDDVPYAIQAHAGLAQSLAGLAVEIDIALHRAVMIIGQPCLQPRLQVPDIDVGMAVTVADDIQSSVVAAE
jgi:hypothetical protein